MIHSRCRENHWVQAGADGAASAPRRFAGWVRQGAGTGPRGRRGITLVEVSVAAVLLAAGLSILVETLGWAAAERRESRRRQWALEEAENIVERLSAEPSLALASEGIVPLERALGRRVRESLPEGKLSIEMLPPTGPAEAQRLDVELTWRRRGGDLASPVRLTTWINVRRQAKEP